MLRTLYYLFITGFLIHVKELSGGRDVAAGCGLGLRGETLSGRVVHVSTNRGGTTWLLAGSQSPLR